MSKKTELSVIIIYSSDQKYNDIRSLYHDYKKGIKGTNLTYEIIYVITGDMPSVMSELHAMTDEGSQFKIIKLALPFGEAAALNAAYQNSMGNIILILPAHKQVHESEIPHLIEALADSDMVISRRYPRLDNIFNRVQSKIFHFLIWMATKMKFRDLNCGARVFKRIIMEKISIYGNQYLFLPLLHAK